MRLSYCLLIFIFIAGCNTNNENDGKDSVELKYKNITETRASVNFLPIKMYSEVMKSFETNDTFKVNLYETKQTFKYLIKINYKQLDAEDTLRIPNFGINPLIEIKKGDKRPSCIVGFFDEHKQFRESKMVSYEDSEIKIHVLKHYAVTTYQDTVK